MNDALAFGIFLVFLLIINYVCPPPEGWPPDVKPSMLDMLIDRWKSRRR